ncbi:MAG: glycoside hydrolase family 30 protein [Gammaproteobacteria bacterium]|nr:glycoside hydrolase family 30 protein [Gammaproteobacteria bacterium]
MRIPMRNEILMLVVVVALLAFCSGCGTHDAWNTQEILVTSEAGDKIAVQPNLAFKDGRAVGTVVEVFPQQLKQTIDGIGSSFTESSAYVLAHLDPAKRKEVMEKIYGEDGANLSIARTHIGACDFAVEGRYSYADVPGDTALDHFSIQPDKDGFDTRVHTGIKEPAYDLLPMIKEALAIKASQSDSDLRIIGSAWTAPAWMKDIEDWYIPGSPENNWEGGGGSLKPEYESSYANYLIKYLDAYAAEGVPVWGMTPVNEPHGNNGQWESMHFTPETQNEFIKRYLGPALKAGAHADTRVLIFDQNRDQLEHWTDVMFADPETAPYLYGVAIHWYSSTFKVHEDALDRVHAKFPQFSIVHSEGCIDDLGKPAPDWVRDPDLSTETDWFNNDAFWWNANATDWAFQAPWAFVDEADHPVYTPVHRYARNIIVSLDHWMTGWVDWNIVLDAQGGPNHVGNYCGAPIMIDKTTGQVHYTPIYHVLSQLSRTIRPGDRAIQTRKQLGGLADDTLHSCATLNGDQLLSVQLLNTGKEALTVNLQIAERFVELKVPANSVQTVRVQL